MRLPLLLLLALPLLSACVDQVARDATPPISFTQMRQYEMNVADIRITDAYRSPMRAPNVEQEFPVTPAQAMRAWVRERLRASGGQGTLEVIIKDASVVETPLPRTAGIQGAFTDDQASRLDAKLEVEMRIYGSGSALSDASISAVATRSDTLPENASPARRSALYQSMTNALMQEMNAELEKNFQQYFSRYIRYGG